MKLNTSESAVTKATTKLEDPPKPVPGLKSQYTVISKPSIILHFLRHDVTNPSRFSLILSKSETRKLSSSFVFKDFTLNLFVKLRVTGHSGIFANC